MDDVETVFRGSDTSFAIKKDGTLWVWGKNLREQLSDETTEYDMKPIQIMTDVETILRRSDSVFAIKKDGTLWVWQKYYKASTYEYKLVQVHFG